MGIPHELFRHGGLVRSLEQAARARGQQPEQVVRSIVFRLRAGRFLTVLAAGPARISWKKLRRQLGQRRLTTASPEEVLLVTGYRMETVTPLGSRHPLPVLVLRRILMETHTSIGSRTPNTGIILRSEDLVRAITHAAKGDLGAEP